MIAASLLLIAGAVTLLVMGLWLSSSALLGASIAASVLTAVVLIIGARRMVVAPTAPPDPDGYDPDPVAAADSGGMTGPYGGRGHRDDGYDLGAYQGDRGGFGGAAGPGRYPDPELAPAFAREPTAELRQTTHRSAAPPEAVTTTIPAQPGPAYDAPDDTGELELDPPDEPTPQQVSAADAARVGQMVTEVLVVDGRPRYHLPGCVHLLGRESEPLPVGEAIELGFTPCSLCEPDSALLADARRV